MEAESVDVVFQATGLDEIEEGESVDGDGRRGPEEMREGRREERGRREEGRKGEGLCIPSTDLSWCGPVSGPGEWMVTLAPTLSPGVLGLGQQGNWPSEHMFEAREEEGPMRGPGRGGQTGLGCGEGEGSWRGGLEAGS